MLKRIRPRARKFGLIGLLPVVLYLLKLAFEAVAEKEIQDWWTDTAIPFLGSKVEIRVWILCLSITSLIALGLTAYWYVKRPARVIKGKPNPNRIRSPRPIDDLEDSAYRYNNIDVIKAFKKARDGELPINIFATIVEQSVNSGSLQPHVGAELLEKFHYELKIRSDERWEAQEERRSR